MRDYRVALLLPSGAVQVGWGFTANHGGPDSVCDAEAIRSANRIARQNHASVFSLQEQIGPYESRVIDTAVKP